MKKYFNLFIVICLCLCLTGCFKRDNMDNIEIYTTSYPIEYITSRLYKNHSTIKSIYPDGVNINEFTLNKKQINDYSKSNLFIFNGLSKEKDYVVPMINKNEDIKIIDTTLSMEYLYGMEELWLDPSNLLMIAKNIDTGFNEYIENYYLKNEIKENYEKLKIELSELDAKIRLIAESSDNKTIVVGNNVFKFLEKYGFEVISLDEENKDLTKDINKAHKLITTNKIKYIVVKDDSEINNTVNRFKNNYNIEILKVHPLSNISETERENKDNYFSLMNKNLELLKKEVYN